MGTFIDIITEFFLELCGKISCYVSEVVIVDKIHPLNSVALVRKRTIPTAAAASRRS